MNDLEPPRDAFHGKNKKAGQIQSRLILATWIVLAVVLMAEIYWGNTIPAMLTVGGAALLAIPYGLIRRGHLNASGMLIVIFVAGLVTTLATTGKGIHDISMAALPIVIIFASLALDRSGARTGVLFTILCIAWLTFGEAHGLFTAEPYDKADWLDFILISSILIVTALAVNSLVQNIRVNLQKAEQEIERRRQMEAALVSKTEEVDQYFRASIDLFCIADTNGTFRRLNPQWKETLGYDLNELEGKSFLDLVHPDDLDATLAAVAKLSGQESIMNFVNRYRCKDGSYRWIEWRSVPSGNTIYAAARDITEHKKMEDQLRYQSTHDILTGIYNRSFFEAELVRLEGGREYPVSIIVADVDGLKVVNDTQGHTAGDQLLKQAAMIIKSVFRTEDVVARIGGDEFAVLLPNTDAVSVEHKVAAIREKLVKNNEEQTNFPVNISIGSATAERGDLIGVFTLADQRMYQDKSIRLGKPGSAAMG